MATYKVTALLSDGQYLSEERVTTTPPEFASRILGRVANTVEDMLLHKAIDADVTKLTIEFVR